MITRKLSTPRTSPLGIAVQTNNRPTSTASCPKETTYIHPAGENNNLSRFAAVFLLALTGSIACINPQNQDLLVQEAGTPKNTNSDPSKNKKEIEFNQKLEYAQKHLFTGHLLHTLDKLDDLDGISSGRHLTSQMLMSKRLTPEMLPVLNKIFSEGPDEVMVAEFTKPGEFKGEDFGRGLRLILRKRIGHLNTSTILFLDYNEKTRKLEFPQDFFFNDKRRIIPDAVRMLIEYDVKASPEELKEHNNRYADHLNSGFFGATISAEINGDFPEVTNFHIYPTRDDNDELPVDREGRTIGVVSLIAGCIGCHERKEGFGSTGTSFETLQRDVHLPENQDITIKHFSEFARKNRHIDPSDKEALDRLEIMLRSPKENLYDLLPTGFMEALRSKQPTLTHPSSIMRRYNDIDFTRLLKSK